MLLFSLFLQMSLILTQSSHKVHLSVADLVDALFSAPVHKDSEYWFVFNFNGLYLISRLRLHLPLSGLLKEHYYLQWGSMKISLVLTLGRALLQYVDDLMLWSSTHEQNEKDTVKLLKHFAAEGHKVRHLPWPWHSKHYTHHKEENVLPQDVFLLP